MDFQDLKNKSVAELRELLVNEQGTLHALRTKDKAKQLKQVHKLKLSRQTIARITMLLTSHKQ